MTTTMNNIILDDSVSGDVREKNAVLLAQALNINFAAPFAAIAKRLGLDNLSLVPVLYASKTGELDVRFASANLIANAGVFAAVCKEVRIVGRGFIDQRNDNGHAKFMVDVNLQYKCKNNDSATRELARLPPVCHKVPFVKSPIILTIEHTQLTDIAPTEYLRLV